MSDPATSAEYMDRFTKNQTMEGEGFDTLIHIPCPFCAAPDFYIYYILSAEEEMKKESRCKCCGRSAKVLTDRVCGSTTMEVVQTGGDDPPPYLPPIRRVT